MLNDSLSYAKDAVWEKWVRWILLIVSAIIFPLLWGYALEVVRGKKPAPELENWGKLFVDGLKLLLIVIIYAIPALILLIGFVGVGALMALAGAFASSPGTVLAGIGSIIGGILVAFIVAIIIALVEIIGIIRFARTGSIGEAFNFNAILDHIGKIGWVSYIVNLIVLVIVVIVIAAVLNFIPVIGQVLLFILSPVITIFEARYVTLVYDSAQPAAAPAA